MTNRALSSSKFKSGLDNGHSIFYSNNDHLTPTAMKVVCTEGVCSSWELTQPIVAKILLESEHQCLCQKGWILVFTEPPVTPTSASKTGSPTHFQVRREPQQVHLRHSSALNCTECRYNDFGMIIEKSSLPSECTSPADPN